MPAKKKVQSSSEFNFFFKWWESALALAKDDHAVTERASFSRASSKKRRFERSKLSSPRMKNSIRRKSPGRQ
jgi:hypothetical protein